jgi:multisubunit Na+/H+ antiporter MnhG subunit
VLAAGYDLVFGVILIVIGVWLWNNTWTTEWFVRLVAVILGLIGLYLLVVGALRV